MEVCINKHRSQAFPEVTETFVKDISLGLLKLAENLNFSLEEVDRQVSFESFKLWISIIRALLKDNDQGNTKFANNIIQNHPSAFNFERKMNTSGNKLNSEENLTNLLGPEIKISNESDLKTETCSWLFNCLRRMCEAPESSTSLLERQENLYLSKGSNTSAQQYFKTCLQEKGTQIEKATHQSEVPLSNCELKTFGSSADIKRSRNHEPLNGHCNTEEEKLYKIFDGIFASHMSGDRSPENDIGNEKFEPQLSSKLNNKLATGDGQHILRSHKSENEHATYKTSIEINNISDTSSGIYTANIYEKTSVNSTDSEEHIYQEIDSRPSSIDTGICSNISSQSRNMAKELTYVDVVAYAVDPYFRNSTEKQTEHAVTRPARRRTLLYRFKRRIRRVFTSLKAHFT